PHRVRVHSPHRPQLPALRRTRRGRGDGRTMKCCSCKRTIASGAEAQKMILEYTQPDHTVKRFGYLMADGPLTPPTGVLAKAWHHKCFHIVRKREARGDAVTGRVVGAGILPGSYTGTDSTVDERLADRMDELHALARQIGKPIGDAEVVEAFRARAHGG